MQSSETRVIVIGGGFGGLHAVRALARAPVQVLLVDRNNHHLFQPLLYQVATAALSPADIASPIRHVVWRQRNVRTVMGTVTRIDAERRVVELDGRDEEAYDFLIVATGATYSYFGNDEWARIAPGLKTIDDAMTIRRRFLMAFERAEREADERARQRMLTFVIVGGGPTGVELAGAMIEAANHTIRCDFRRVDPTLARVILVQAGDHVLNGFPEPAGRAALDALRRLGVEVRIKTRATDIDESGVTLVPEDGGDPDRIETECVIWAAGVAGNPPTGVPGRTRKDGRVPVRPDLSVEGHPEVFVIGDLAHAEDEKTGKSVPGLAPAAIQMGRHAGEVIAAETRAQAAGTETPPRPAFHYRDKGMMAVIGRGQAVAHLRGRTFRGFPAWVLWSTAHLLFLVGFRNRLLVALQWFWEYATWQRGARLIFGLRAPAGTVPGSERAEEIEHAGSGTGPAD